ncbi:MAG: four helix bundle protein [Saprospiraceae bacterium]|nr:four helix bundle protein [Saprospiraceae bacterium]MCB9306992.1 four helix bundle protein [Lewinellaceae bacterium]MCB9355937.1 four helix bundle protein [Lewinellaceae bacterium]
MTLESVNENPVLRHTFEFALLVDAYTAHLYELRRYDLARLLFRTGTSIGANVFEAQHPESRQDFVHKMKIAAKEAAETNFWLLICQNRPGYPTCDHLLAKHDEINRLLSAIISSSKKANPD